MFSQLPQAHSQYSTATFMAMIVSDQNGQAAMKNIWSTGIQPDHDRREPAEQLAGRQHSQPEPPQSGKGTRGERTRLTTNGTGPVTASYRGKRAA